MERVYSSEPRKYDCPNKWADRAGHRIEAFVIHKPEGEIPGTIDYMLDPATQKSYNFVIGYDGTIHELVRPEESSWASGVVDRPTWIGIREGVNPNYYTLGIALEGFAAQPHTKAQFRALCALIADVALADGIAVNDHTVVWHREINAGKTCPGDHLSKQAVVAAAAALVVAGSIVGWEPERI